MFIYTEAYTIVSAIGYSIIGAIAIVIDLLFKDKDLKTRKMVLNVLTGVLLFLELLKQIQNIIPGFEYGSLWFWKKEGATFTAYALPFHLCSFFIFWPLAAFFTKGKVQDFFEKLTGTWAALIFLSTVLYPEVIYGDALTSLYNGGPLTHTVVFHLLVCLYFLIVMALRPFKFELKKAWIPAVGILIYGLVAAPFAFIFKTNYCSIYEPHSFGFTIAVFEKFGYGLYLPLIALLGCSAATIIYLIIIGMNKIIDLLRCPKGLLFGFSTLVVLLIPSGFIFKACMGNNWNNMAFIFILLAMLILTCSIAILLVKYVFKKKDKN